MIRKIACFLSFYFAGVIMGLMLADPKFATTGLYAAKFAMILFGAIFLTGIERK